MSLEFSHLLAHPSTDLSPTDLEIITASGFEAFSAKDKDWAKLIGFSCETASILPLEDADQKTLQVSLGEATPSPSDPWWMAGVCEKLPEGTYRFKDDIEDDALFTGAIGWLLSHYRFDRYLSEPKATPKRVLVLPEGMNLQPIIDQAKSMALVRDLVNTPTEDMGPADLQAAAETLAEEFGAKCTAIIADELLAQNFRTIHAVGRAAPEDRAPRLIDLRWGDDNNFPSITLVGKGVCFDTGGLGLKPAAYMRNMKKDMAGAAHVLGLARMIMAAGLDVRLRVLIPAVENNISKESFRPGDVIKTRKGLTVEIDHTDAEGRLILCDALALASEEKPSLILDFATLTGANTIAVGPDFAGVYTDSETLWTSLQQASSMTGDPLWRMPMWAPYGKKLKSDIADVNHRTPGFNYAGGTTAALFLRKFVPPELAYAHFDFYAWHDEALPGRQKGAAAMAIRAAFDVIQTYDW